MSAGQHKKELIKLLRACSGRWNLWDVWNDFITLAAIAMSNAVDLRQFETREAEYMRIIGRYERAEAERFPHMFGALVLAMEAQTTDVLGEIFGELDLGNAARGQFFTPFSLCKLMADLTVDQQFIDQVSGKGWISVQEPACGAGAILIGLADSMRDKGLNPQQQLHITAIDVDRRAALMCYLQLSLMNIPAIVIVGNTLTLEVHEKWFTPAHILGGWSFRLGRNHVPTIEVESTPADTAPPAPAEATETQQLPLFAAAAA